MVDVVQGDLFDADVAALVNPVHCAGVMGRGLALQFKARFPDNTAQYEAACETGRLSPGDVLVHDRGGLFDAERPRYILNVATKDHWTDASRPAHIEAGMDGVVEQTRRRGLSSLAVPALGCGGGGLDWPTVRPLLVEPLSALDDCRALVYAPRSAGGPGGADAPDPAEMTPGQALFLMALNEYAGTGQPISPHAAHNVAYLLQRAGAALHLQFEPGAYGLRASGLRAVLRYMDGRFVDGYDPAHQDAPFRLRAAAVAAARRAVDPDEAPLATARRWLDGVSSRDALELRARVLWTVRHDPTARRRPDAAVRAVQDGSRRTARRFSAEQIAAAWRHVAAADAPAPPDSADG
jgi:O-acetyl-ADP-ribose deacetylase (regulator of RNase III)